MAEFYGLAELVTLHDGRSFLEEWIEQRDASLSGIKGLAQTIRWEEFDQKTITWYFNVLRSRTKSEEAQPAKLIRELLLDGRGEITVDEVRQLRLLFGQGGVAIRREIGRDVLDLRVRQSTESRWDERQEIANNLLDSLGQAIDFIGKHNPSLKPHLVELARQRMKAK